MAKFLGFWRNHKFGDFVNFVFKVAGVGWVFEEKELDLCGGLNNSISFGSFK